MPLSTWLVRFITITNSYLSQLQRALPKVVKQNQQACSARDNTANLIQLLPPDDLPPDNMWWEDGVIVVETKPGPKPFGDDYPTTVGRRPRGPQPPGPLFTSASPPSDEPGSEQSHVP